MTTVEDRLNRLGNVQAPTRHESMDEFKARLERMRPRKHDDKAGRFKVGDIVRWRGKSGAALRHGTVVEVVKRGMYPSTRHKDLVLHGYYRETESYVIQSGERQFWPRVGNLRRVEP